MFRHDGLAGSEPPLGVLYRPRSGILQKGRCVGSSGAMNYLRWCSNLIQFQFISHISICDLNLSSEHFPRMFLTPHNFNSTRLLYIIFSIYPRFDNTTLYITSLLPNHFSPFFRNFTISVLPLVATTPYPLLSRAAFFP